MLSVHNLSFAYTTEQPTLTDISFTASEGKLISLLGPNGSGKTTLFRCLSGILPVTGGSVHINGYNISELSPKEKAKQIAYVPQIHRPNFGYSVLDTVLMGVAREISLFRSPNVDHVKRAIEALRTVGKDNIAQKMFTKISGGEQQLVLIARSLAQNSKTIILDEPISSLDYGNQYKIMNIVKKLSKQGFLIILSTHNPQIALDYSDQILAMKAGRLMACGPPNKIINPSLIYNLYGIKVTIKNSQQGMQILPLNIESGGKS